MQLVTTTDREFTGSLTCLDHDGNVLLFDAFEHLTLGGETVDRSLTQIVVPFKLIKRASVLVRGDASLGALSS